MLNNFRSAYQFGLLRWFNSVRAFFVLSFSIQILRIPFTLLFGYVICFPSNFSIGQILQRRSEFQDTFLFQEGMEQLVLITLYVIALVSIWGFGFLVDFTRNF